MRSTPIYDGRKLKRVLADQGRTAKWLAQRCRVSEAHLSRVISGERLASDALAQRAAEALGIPLFLAFDFPDGNDSIPARKEMIA